jgi:hypothetical protein
MLGTAGEYVAMADSLEQYISCQHIHGEPFDLIIFVEGEFIKVQVKVEDKNRLRKNPSFRPTKGRLKAVSYNEGEVDIFAFVNMRDRSVAWMHIAETSLSRHTIKVESFKDYTLERALSIYFSRSQISGISSNSSQSKLIES